MILYLLLPYDIIPEAVYGVVGLLDDIVVVLIFIIPTARLIYSAYSNNLLQNGEVRNDSIEIQADSEAPPVESVNSQS